MNNENEYVVVADGIIEVGDYMDWSHCGEFIVAAEVSEYSPWIGSGIAETRERNNGQLKVWRKRK